MSHGTVHLPSSQRYYLTAKGIGEAAGILGFATPSDFVRAYPMSREWLALLVRRMDAVAAVYRFATSMSAGTGSRRSWVEFHIKETIWRHYYPSTTVDGPARSAAGYGPATPT